MMTSTLGFTVRLVASGEDLRDACSVRAQAYGRHLPELGRRLAEPDELDFDPGTTVFICRDKATGRASGTMRIQSSLHSPLLMERSVVLPGWLASSSRAEVTRLAVPVGADPLARLCLWKASYLFCMANHLRWMVIGARSEALIRNYRRLGFVDVFEPEELMPLAHTGGMLHRIMAFDATSAERVWGATRHPLYNFIFETAHDDLQVRRPQEIVDFPVLPLHALRTDPVAQAAP
jgi:hypothetical protein